MMPIAHKKDYRTYSNVQETVRNQYKDALHAFYAHKLPVNSLQKEGQNMHNDSEKAKLITDGHQTSSFSTACNKFPVLMYIITYSIKRFAKCAFQYKVYHFLHIDCT